MLTKAHEEEMAFSGARKNDLSRYVRYLPASMRPLLETPLRDYRIWMGLGWNDTVQNYRRTLLGPFWLTLNIVIFAAAVSVVYGALLGVPPGEYAPYVVCGMIVWFWVSAMLSDLGNTFISYAAFIRGMPIDKSVLLWSSAFKLVIVLAHHIVIMIPLFLFGMIQINLYTLMVIPAIVVLFALTIPFAAVMSLVFARYRDIPRLISGTMIVLLMTTPVFWQPTMISGWRSAIVYFNPFYYLINFVRQPLLGNELDYTTILVVLSMTVAAWVFGSRFYNKYQKNVVFWV